MNTDHFIVVGDRVLLKQRSAEQQTKSGLYLPPGVKENEKIQSGYILRVGPGYAIPANADADEAWKGATEHVRYIPLQARVGDLAIYLQNSAWEVDYDDEHYVIVPQQAILLLIREEF